MQGRRARNHRRFATKPSGARSGSSPSFAGDGLWLVLRGQCPVTEGVPDESISSTPQTEPSGLLFDPMATFVG
jgi:hypothetical protein